MINEQIIFLKYRTLIKTFNEAYTMLLKAFT